MMTVNKDKDALFRKPRGKGLIKSRSCSSMPSSSYSALLQLIVRQAFDEFVFALSLHRDVDDGRIDPSIEAY
jgi:hypothetical protein